VFANIVCYPVLARLPKGENAHCTIKHHQWWATLCTERFKHLIFKNFKIERQFQLIRLKSIDYTNFQLIRLKSIDYTNNSN
jgi:hypothetical protein